MTVNQSLTDIFGVSLVKLRKLHFIRYKVMFYPDRYQDIVDEMITTQDIDRAYRQIIMDVLRRHLQKEFTRGIRR